MPPVKVLGIFGSEPRALGVERCVAPGVDADVGAVGLDVDQFGARAGDVNGLLEGSDRQRDVPPNGRTRLGPEDVLDRGEPGKLRDQFVVAG